MRVIILAAGRGRRMLSQTETKPKCLIEVGGKALIDWQISAFREAGLLDIGLVTGYKSELLKEYALKQFHNPKWATTNMVFSLLAAKEWLIKYECVIGYSDLFFQAPGLIPLLNSGCKLKVLYDPNWRSLWEARFDDPLSDAETFKINDQGLITEIGKKTKAIDEIQGQYMGLVKISPDAWKSVLSTLDNLSSVQIRNLQMTKLLQLLIETKSIDVCAVPYFGFWSEVDSQTDLEFLSAQLPL